MAWFDLTGVNTKAQRNKWLALSHILNQNSVEGGRPASTVLISHLLKAECWVHRAGKSSGLGGFLRP